MIDRDTIFGNPFIIGPDGNRKTVLAKFRAYAAKRIATDPAWRKAVEALEGRLGCWCKPKDCHGDWYVEYLSTRCPDMSKL